MWVSRIPGKSRAPAKFCSSDWHIMYVYIHLHTQSRTHGLLPQSTNKPLAASRTEGWARQEEEWSGGRGRINSDDPGTADLQAELGL